MNDVGAQIVLNLHANGEMSISGNIGDVKLALGMVDHARDAIKGQLSRQPNIIIPNYDVEVVQTLPTKEMGDMPLRDRGDMVQRCPS